MHNFDYVRCLMGNIVCGIWSIKYEVQRNVHIVIQSYFRNEFNLNNAMYASEFELSERNTLDRLAPDMLNSQHSTLKTNRTTFRIECILPCHPLKLSAHDVDFHMIKSRLGFRNSLHMQNNHFNFTNK